jgi:phage virion morphogenesis protein
MQFKIDVEADEVLADLARQLEKINNLNKPLRKAGLYMERETKLNFAKQSDPDGMPWAPLKPATLRKKKTSAILRESGSLAASIALFSVSKTSAIVGSGVEYGAYHQTGTSRMPKRSFLGISGNHVSNIQKIFEDYLRT